MPPVENPVINSPFAAPEQHFRFSEEGITNEIVQQRRAPMASSKKKGKQLILSEWTQDLVEL